MGFLASSGLMHLHCPFYTTHSRSAQRVCGREDSFAASPQLQRGNTPPQGWEQVEASKVPGAKYKDALTARFTYVQTHDVAHPNPSPAPPAGICWRQLHQDLCHQDNRDWLANWHAYPSQIPSFHFWITSALKLFSPPAKLPFMTPFCLTFPPKL